MMLAFFIVSAVRYKKAIWIILSYTIVRCIVHMLVVTTMNWSSLKAEFDDVQESYLCGSCQLPSDFSLYLFHL